MPVHRFRYPIVVELRPGNLGSASRGHPDAPALREHVVAAEVAVPAARAPGRRGQRWRD